MTDETKSWVEVAPRTTRYHIAPTTSLSNLGAMPVLAFAFGDQTGALVTTALMLTPEGLKKLKKDFLRAYDEVQRQVKELQADIDKPSQNGDVSD